jgi:HK97 family phage major capsid protein
LLRELRQKRAKLIEKQRGLINTAKLEARTFIEEEEKAFEDLDHQIHSLEKQIGREEQVASREKELDQPIGKAFRPILPGPDPIEKRDNAGFKSFGEFIHAVRFGDAKGRLKETQKDFSMGEDAGGGYLVPEQFRQEMLKLSPEDSVIRPRATVLSPGTPPDAKITMPAFDQGAKGAYGGVEVKWIGEGEEKPKTQTAFKEISLQPHEVAAHVVVTDKLLRNWTAASSFISTLLRGAMNNAEDMAFLKGDGVGKPNGILHAPGAEVMQRMAPNTLSYGDVTNMLSKLLPSSYSSAVWVASHQLLPALMQLQDSAGNYIFIHGDATKGIASTLVGLPIRFTGKTVSLGKKGDLMLVDLSYYLIKDGSGPYVEASPHVYFRENKTVIKCFWNVDGKPWVSDPLALEDGSTTVSPYVILDAVKEKK